LEDAFGIQFDANELAKMDSVRSVVCVVERKTELSAGL